MTVRSDAVPGLVRGFQEVCAACGVFSYINILIFSTAK